MAHLRHARNYRHQLVVFFSTTISPRRPILTPRTRTEPRGKAPFEFRNVRYPPPQTRGSTPNAARVLSSPAAAAGLDRIERRKHDIAKRTERISLFKDLRAIYVILFFNTY